MKVVTLREFTEVEEPLTLAEVATYLSVPIRVVKRLIVAGKLAAGRRGVTVDALEAFIDTERARNDLRRLSVMYVLANSRRALQTEDGTIDLTHPLHVD